MILHLFHMKIIKRNFTLPQGNFWYFSFYTTHRSYSFNAAHSWNTYSCYVATSRSDTVHIESYAPCRLRNQGTLLQGVIDPLNAVRMHGQQETAAKVHQCFYRSTEFYKFIINAIKEKQSFPFLMEVKEKLTEILIRD